MTTQSQKIGYGTAGQSGEGRKRFFFEKKAVPARREPKNV
jgi:hypothetical protein